MFGCNFEVNALSRFLNWDLFKICVRICDMNSTLGSVVPLAMFCFCLGIEEPKHKKAHISMVFKVGDLTESTVADWGKAFTCVPGKFSWHKATDDLAHFWCYRAPFHTHHHQRNYFGHHHREHNQIGHQLSVIIRMCWLLYHGTIKEYLVNKDNAMHLPLQQCTAM